MNIISKLNVIIISAVLTSCGSNSGSESSSLATRMDSISYGYGVSMLTQLKVDISENLNSDLCLAGIQEVVGDTDPKFSPQEANEIFRGFMTFGRGMSYEVSNSTSSDNLAHLLDSASYSLGVLLGSSLSNGSFDINLELVGRAFNDVNSEVGALLTKETSDSLLAIYSTELRAKLAVENLEAGQAFLQENGKREGVITTESGLQYEVITEGSGPNAQDENSISILYSGSFINGNVFDSTQDGAPITMGVTQFIPGFSEALKLMNVGTKLKVYIPSDIAYGPNGNGPSIPPNKTIIFEIELMEIL